MTALWRQFNGDFELTASDAHDGLHLRAGMLTTNAETIPQGRVQAVRMVEPLLCVPSVGVGCTWTSLGAIVSRARATSRAAS
jgi:uncharacterized membrane protein YdbT with pleckstrin-like domain